MLSSRPRWRRPLTGSAAARRISSWTTRRRTTPARCATRFRRATRRFRTVWAPENRNVVDAYLRGFRAAYDGGHEFIVEMDAGLSHDPAAIPRFLRALADGHECVFGSRFCPGGSMAESSFFRRTLSRSGTVLSNTLLGTRLADMTSGFEAFRRDVIARAARVSAAFPRPFLSDRSALPPAAATRRGTADSLPGAEQLGFEKRDPQRRAHAALLFWAAFARARPGAVSPSAGRTLPVGRDATEGARRHSAFDGGVWRPTFLVLCKPPNSKSLE